MDFSLIFTPRVPTKTLRQVVSKPATPSYKTPSFRSTWTPGAPDSGRAASSTSPWNPDMEALRRKTTFTVGSTVPQYTGLAIPGPFFVHEVLPTEYFLFQLLTPKFAVVL